MWNTITLAYYILMYNYLCNLNINQKYKIMLNIISNYSYYILTQGKHHVPTI